MMRRLNPLPQLVPDRFRLIRKQVDGLIWERREPLAVAGSAVTEERLRVEQAAELAYAPVRAGEHFGPAGGGWEHRWLRLWVPAATAAEAGRRFLRWKSQGETTAYRDGVPWAGLDVGHPTCPLPDAATELYLDTGTWATGIWAPGAEPIGPYGLRFDYAELRVRDGAAWDLKWDLDALLQLVEMLLADDGLEVPNAGHGQRPPFEEAAPLLRKLVRGIDRCCDAWVEGGVAGMKAAAGELLAALPAESWQPRAALIGHAHIDVVWLWPETATRHKNVHSFATALRLLEAYPEMVFAHSTPAVYRAVQEDAPALVPQIKRHLAAGRWELMGGFEVEPDVNLPAGEALARSAVYGNRFIAGFSGKPSDVCWIPDVFGYSNCLPQILRLAGITRFYTTKMTWSQVTRFPYNSFVWRGSDGVSEVTTHLATIGYNGQVALAENRDALRRHRQLDVHDALLIGTGLGDGGGGPNETVAERARRFRNLAGAPRHGWHSSAAFFDDLDAVRNQLPVYQGELYMEAHRGVLTSQAEYKRLYRACESALLAHEALRAVDGAEPLGEAAWLRVLFGQFHDALPGSSITRVYDELKAEFRQILAREQAAAAQELGGASAAGTAAAGTMQTGASQAGTSQAGTSPADASQADASQADALNVGALEALAFNPLPQARRVYLPERDLLLDLPPVGTASLAAARPAPAVHAGRDRLANGIVEARFDHRGQLAGLAIEGAALALAAPAGLRLAHDHPHNYDAWEIDHYSAKTALPVADRLALEVAEGTGRRGVLQASAAIGAASRLTIRYLLDPGSRYLMVEVDVDWREEHRLLRYHVPTGYHGRFATFGCPFGAIKRPQLPGGPADEAMWEVAGSRWAAVHDDLERGLALVTEAKYGFCCHRGDLGVSLLKAARHPDPTADLGRHTIRFALGRHRTESEPGAPSTACTADALYTPLVVAEAGAPRQSPFRFDALGSLCPSWVLPSESGPGFVVRLHETAGAGGTAVLRLTVPARSVSLVDFRERELAAAASLAEAAYAIPYGPYQVVSVLVQR